MQVRRFIAGGLVAASVILVPFSSMAFADQKEGGGGTTTYCYRPGDETTKTNPYSPGSTYTDWSTTPPRTYKCGSDGTWTVMTIVVHHHPVIERVPGANQLAAR
ncbi:MAG: hypothetical protein JOZ37_15510 [Actinobacteria bacterium]|nr:hypothetical protein [Actinomycetota bacterium]MBV9253712.1 hypothetical protein [Actinomycetota bacterium]MBV9665375.1 hypothetical protein [Actinomycetota bacterium]